MTIFRTYSELARLETFDERYEYLKIKGRVGDPTFGFERYLNQRFYISSEWKRIRQHVIARDLGFDLGIEDHPIFDKVIIHHMNPMDPNDIINSNEDILDIEFLITTSHRTHNAIHYGDKSLLYKPYTPRFSGDTNLW